MSDQATAVTVDDLANMLGDDPDTPTPPIEEPEEGATDEPQEEPEEPQEEDEVPAEPEKYRVKVKNAEGTDEERDLSLDELAQGYMLQSDYTRKTQAAAQEIAQANQQASQEVAKVQQAVVEQINQMQALVLQAAAPELQNVNWSQLAAQDPAEYVRLQARQQELSQLLQVLDGQRQQYQQQAQAQQAQQRDQAISQSAQYLKESIKGFDAKQYQDTLSGGVATYGFKPEEVAQIVDGRMVHVLHDALKWRAAQAAKPQAMKKIAEAPKVIKPSAPQPKPRGIEATKRLKASGRLEDLTAFL